MSNMLRERTASDMRILPDSGIAKARISRGEPEAFYASRDKEWEIQAAVERICFEAGDGNISFERVGKIIKEHGAESLLAEIIAKCHSKGVSFRKVTPAS